MSVFVICATPVYGHVRPLIQIGADLHTRGHRVIILTGSRFTETAIAAGLEHVPLPPDVDYDDRNLESFLPARSSQRGLAKARYDIEGMFIRTIPGQTAALQQILDTVTPAAILVDSAFAGVLPLLLSGNDRPPVAGIGVLPLSQSSRDLAPFGMGLHPSRSRVGLLRNLLLNFFMRKVIFGRTQRVANRLLVGVGSRKLPGFVMDISSLFDKFLQLSSPDFEYPRTDLAANTVMIGPLPLVTTSDARLPSWWDDLLDGRPVIHVTQGTIDNHDLSKLIRPTIDAVQGMDVTLVVTTGGGGVADLGAVPPNVKVTDFIPYDRLLPLVEVMVTNGGFGGVQAALRYGVPLIVAGDSEEKPEVAARVSYAGAGINLKTGRPKPEMLRDAINEILNSGQYAKSTQAIARAISHQNPLQTISDQLAVLTANHDKPGAVARNG